MAANPQLHLKDVSQEPYIKFSDKSSINYCINEAAQRAGITFRPVQEVSYMTTAVSMVRSAMGFTIIPQLALSGLCLDDVAQVPVADEFAFRCLGTITLNRRTRGPAALAVLNLFQRECRSVADRIQEPRRQPARARRSRAF
jgi:DNA-binding transcriptional LysR family regulator